MTLTTEQIKTAGVYVRENIGSPDYATTLGECSHDLAPTAYASPSDRSYPIWSKSAAWHSYAAARLHNATDTVLEAIKDAAEAHGILADLSKIDELMDSRKLAAEEDPTAELNGYALPGCEDLLATNPFHIEESARKLASVAVRNQLNAAEQHEAAVNLVKNAAYFEMDESRLPESVRKMARMAMTSHAIAAEQLDRRAMFTRDENAKKAYAEIKEAILETEDGDMDSQIKWACAIEEMDKLAGLQSNWGRHGFMWPVDVVLSGATEKDVEKVAGQIATLAGHVVPLEAIAEIPAHKLASEFSGESLDTIRDILAAYGNADVVSEKCCSLSEDDQRHLLHMAVLA